MAEPNLQNRYLIGRELMPDAGQGAMYAAHDDQLERPVCIRYVSTEASAKVLQRYQREIRILGGLDHAALPRLLDSSVTGETPFLVFEPLVGKPLSEWLDAPMSARDASAIALDLAEGLHLAHARGFVHGRVVPGCVLVTAQGQPKLLGFDRARLGSRQSTTTSDIASNVDPFFAPEIFLDDRRDVRTDLYGVAAILYYLLTGHAPIAVDGLRTYESIQALVTQQRTPARHYRRAISHELQDFLITALAIDPEDRYQSGPEFCDALKEADSGRPSFEPHRSMRMRTKIDGRYFIESKLGHGGGGTVFLARDRQLDRHVAIKFVQVSEEDHLLEARAMAQVCHPNIVQVFDVGRDEMAGYIVMENVPGITVEERIRQGQLSVDEVVSLLDRVSRGLTVLHQAGLVHGDVKPSNILLGPANRVCLADFGLVRTRATWADPAARLGGTPAYFAPERVFQNVRAKDAHLIDIYALGILMFELFTGELPLDAPNPLALLRKHAREVPAPLSSLKATLAPFDALVASLLAKDPRERPTAAEFRDALYTAHKQSTSNPSGFRILVVDSQQPSREFLGKHLAHIFPKADLGFALSGNEAMVTIQQSPPAVVVLDLVLDDMNAIEFAASVRSSIKEPPPMVVVTGTGSAADWQVLSSLGVAGFLFKPLDPELFELTMRRVLAGSHGGRPTP